METWKVRAAVFAAAVTCLGSRAAAQETSCGPVITRATVARCALKASLAVRAERDELDAARGRHLAVSPILPANPTLSLSVARRSEAGPQVTNWYASVAQELEIAGQRGLRRDSAQAEVDTRQKRVVVSERDVAATALVAFYEALAAREEQALASRLTAIAKAVSAVAHAKADKGLIAPVDADVADAATVRMTRSKLAADRQLATATAFLATLIGSDPAIGNIRAEGELEPIASIDVATRSVAAKNLSARPEVQALDDERRALELRAAAFRRSRVPNPTISAFVENDGFNEHVFGVGLALPIPIPGNVGRTYNGEVAEAEALARRAATERERTMREIRLAVTTAARAFESRRLEAQAFSPELLANAETSLRSLGQEVESGRLTIREAVVAQQALIELLQGYLAARRALCLASVDLARAAGIPLERGAP